MGGGLVGYGDKVVRGWINQWVLVAESLHGVADGLQEDTVAQFTGCGIVRIGRGNFSDGDHRGRECTLNAMKRQCPWADAHTLLCEQCGYVLAGLPPEGECPECGEAIAASVPSVRVGTPWQQRASFVSYWQTAWQCLTMPVRTLAIMRMDDASARSLRQAHRKLAALLLAPAAGTGILLFLEREWPTAGGGNVSWEPGGPVSSVVVMMILSLLVAPFLLLMFALLNRVEETGLRLFARQRGWRVDSTVAGTITAHGSVGWGIAALAGPLAMPGLLWLEANEWLLPVWTVEHTWKIGLVVLVGGFLWFEIFAWLGVRRCKFVNREGLMPTVSTESGHLESTRLDTTD